MKYIRYFENREEIDPDFYKLYKVLKKFFRGYEVIITPETDEDYSGIDVKSNHGGLLFEFVLGNNDPMSVSIYDNCDEDTDESDFIEYIRYNANDIFGCQFIKLDARLDKFLDCINRADFELWRNVKKYNL